MSNIQEETKKFKQLLDQLPYLSEGEKIIACSMYLAATDDMRQEMDNFYQDQAEKHKLLLEERDRQIEAARQKLNEEMAKPDNL